MMKTAMQAIPGETSPTQRCGARLKPFGRWLPGSSLVAALCLVGPMLAFGRPLRVWSCYRR